ncbi:MAG: low molecular weight phosphotyrosine protein phosphatase [Verrucomicrobiaceae bacterium]|nr:low molecular weight phosphotyrosine protein phosphatase [Verrucomicrobiaceae bacterium]
MSAEPSQFKLLFVCMGNICRSPTADGVMRHLVEKAGLGHRIGIDSAGTGGWHAGNPADHRMRQHAAKRGHALDHLARQVRPGDFDEFDLILVMDQQNLREIRPFNPGGDKMHKVKLFCEFAHGREETEVPDPYYGGAQGFEQVLDIVEHGCAHLLQHIQTQLP